MMFVAVLGIILYAKGGGVFSSGELSAVKPRQEPLAGFESHAAFEAECRQCHTPWQGITADRCQQCHTNVEQQRATKQGLHGLMSETENCRQCHTDHQGREGELTTVSSSIFDHDHLTQFNLARHQQDYAGIPLTCEQCHLNHEYQANNVDCVTCHLAADALFMTIHPNQFGNNCLACHDGVDKMSRFDHDTVFSLTNAHNIDACEVCHSGEPAFETPRQCADCHGEPAIHAGIFGLDCARCHIPTMWIPAQLIQHNFPLDHGDEGQIGCTTCHIETYVIYTCTNCHEHEEIEIERVHLDAGIPDFAQCTDCHAAGLVDDD